MSYCRMSSKSDVYVYLGAEGLVCFGCELEHTALNFVATRRTEMISHLREHKAKGHLVPNKALGRLDAELLESGDLVDIDPEP